jgi:predicted Fe-Mo cluster-binding NifX family protein
MKIAITSTGTDIDSPMDPRFGRAAYILIVDTFTQSVEALDNSENVNAFKGAGIQAAARVAQEKVEALLTGFCGPNAFKTLEAAGVKVVMDVTGTVQEALDAFNEGRVSFSDSPNAPGGGG